MNDGGPTHRAVGFTGGHFTKNLPAENYHRFLLNAVTWAAGIEIPVGGVRTFDELWTPADRVGSALPYELEKEKDWYDGRVRAMNQGPWAFSSIELPGGEVVPKAVAISEYCTYIPTNLLVDTETATVRCFYHSGVLLEHSDRRFGLIDRPKVSAALDFPPGSLDAERRGGGGEVRAAARGRPVRDAGLHDRRRSGPTLRPRQRHAVRDRPRRCGPHPAEGRVSGGWKSRRSR